MDDETLVARMRAGDSDAASSLLSRYQDVAYTTALRLLANTSDAEDITQESLVRAYTHCSELQEHASFPAWLRRITVNLSLNALRRRGLLQFESLDADAGRELQPAGDPSRQQPATPEDEALKGALEGQVKTLIAQLPPEQRVAVVLRDVYGYDVPQIAELQRCGLSAAKMRVQRGRAALRRLLVEARVFSDGSND